MAEMTKHTPTPWNFYEADEGDQYGKPGDTPYIICSTDQMVWSLAAVIGDVPDLPAKENAAHIVRCVNAHDDLVAALKLLADDVRRYPAWERPCHALDVADAALRSLDLSKPVEG